MSISQCKLTAVPVRFQQWLRLGTSHSHLDFVFVPWVQSRGGVLLWTDEVLWVVPHDLDAGRRDTSCWKWRCALKDTHCGVGIVSTSLCAYLCIAWPYLDLIVSWDVCGCYEHQHTEEYEFLQVVSELPKLI